MKQNASNEQTPYFFFNKAQLKQNVKNYSNRLFSFYYSVKSCLFDGLVAEIKPFLDGFSVSSISQLKEVRKVTKDSHIYFVSPLIRDYEVEAINKYGNSVSFNSVEQFDRFKDILNPNIRKFIRLNPEISFLDDSRYDPCRINSKLGVPLIKFLDWFNKSSPKIDGVHFHNNCLSDKPEEIIKTVNHIEDTLKSILHHFTFINIGGGYVFSEELMNTVNHLATDWKKKYNLELIIEPSFDISNNAGYLVSSVVDIFQIKNKQVAILDTSINHLPEVFEYDESPKVFGDHENNSYQYILGGGSCLAGDVFGEYHFKNPLVLGKKVVFIDVGAYSYSRANKFNGIPIPDIYIGDTEPYDFISSKKIKLQEGGA